MSLWRGGFVGGVQVWIIHVHQRKGTWCSVAGGKWSHFKSWFVVSELYLFVTDLIQRYAYGFVYSCQIFITTLSYACGLVVNVVGSSRININAVTFPISKAGGNYNAKSFGLQPRHWDFMLVHDDVIKWKIFSFTGHFRRSPVNSPHKGQWRGAMMFFMCLNKRLSKQWWGWWFKTPWCPLWRRAFWQQPF